MRGTTSIGLGIVVLVAFLPSYLAERVTEFYFLSGDATTFFMWSGDRTTIFVMCTLLFAIASGFEIKNLAAVTVAYTLGVVVLVTLLYYFCIPKVCYSGGVDGLEPLRVAYFFSCLGITGASIGSFARMGNEARSPTLSYVVAGATVGAIAYYPTVFTIAGTRVIAPVDPVPVLLVVALPALVFASRITPVSGWKIGFAVPFAAVLLLLGMTLGIAFQYLPEIAPVVSLIVLAALIGTGIGCVLAAREPPSTIRIGGSRPSSNVLLYVALLVLLLSSVVFLPDATAGVTPQQPSRGSASPYAIGSTAYVGGFATMDFLRLPGVAVTVSFAGTNFTSIQPDNFLSGGLGVHAAHCCVDGIDFSYRFDAYLFHDGSEALVATAWEICDWNMACGGHSWQDLLFLHDEPLGNLPLSSTLHLFLQWGKGRVVYWSYAIDQSATRNFTSFLPPPQENAYFTVGTQGYIPTSPESPRSFYTDSIASTVASPNAPGYYFFQYGMMSGFPIGRPGWAVSFTCPSYLQNGTWKCLEHSDSIQGDQAYWKVIWRWGEPYYNVDARASNNTGVTFSYSPTTIPSFKPLW